MMEKGRAREPFGFSRGNALYFGVIALGSLGLLTLAGRTSPSAVGGLMGYLFGLGLSSAVVAWFFWLLSGKCARTGHITFNVILTLVLLGRCGELVERGERMRRDKEEVAAIRNDFRDDMNSATNFVEATEAFNKNTSVIRDQMAKMEAEASGEEKKILQIIREATTDNLKVVRRWRASAEKLESDGFWDLARLRDDPMAYEDTSGVLDEIEKLTKQYLGLAENMERDYARRLGVLGEDNPRVISTLKGLRASGERTLPDLKLGLEAQLEYNELVRKLFNTLERHHDAWTWDEQLVSESDEFIEAYNGHLDALQRQADRMAEHDARVISNL